MAKDAKARNLEIVLLGDIFDLIRSEQWIKTKVRPWDAKSPKQEQITNFRLFLSQQEEQQPSF